MARSLVNGRNLQHWDVKVMHFSFSYDAPITACARNSRNYTYFLTKYTRYLQVTYLAEKYIEIWHNTYISCCVCMYVCNRMYIRIRIVLYPYTNFWHDSHKTYQNIFHMRENFGHGRSQFLWSPKSESVERNLIQLSQTFNAKSLVAWKTQPGSINMFPKYVS